MAKKRKNPKAAAVPTTSDWAKAAKRFGSKWSATIRKRINAAVRKVKNPSPGWFDRCVDAVAAKGTAADPRAVCGAMEKRFNPIRGRARTIRHRIRRGAKLPNPVEAAARRFEHTHGRPPEDVFEFIEQDHFHSVMPAYGRLDTLSILAIADGETVVTLKDFKGAMLAENEEADKQPQLFIIGGDQAVNLKDFGIRHAHETEVLGFCTEVAYITRKDHLGEAGGAGERATHVHDFGSKRGMDADDYRRHSARLPTIIYDVRNRKMKFAGGTYDLPEIGIRG